MEEGDIEAENSRHFTSPRERRNHVLDTTHHPQIGLNLSTIFYERSFDQLMASVLIKSGKSPSLDAVVEENHL